MNGSTSTIEALFTAERESRRLHAELVKAARAGAGDAAALVTLLTDEATKARALPASEGGEQALRLVRIAAVLGELEGPAAVDLLIDILGSDEPEARHAAGEALEDLAFDRFKEVALGVERALTRLPVGNPALSELPYLLAEVAEPGSLKLLGRFLQHADPEAVAGAIEAIIEMGDPSAAPLLKPLEKDARQVQLEEDSEERVTIGDLASEARELLAELADEQAPPVRGGKNAGGSEGRGPRR
jgi:HEAT repeat protein